MKRSNIGFCVICTVFLLMVVTYAFQNPVYWFIDDIRMREFISGDLTGIPDGHCVYIKYVWSAFLAGLYQIFPSFSWYDISMVGIMAASMCAILYRSLCLCKSGWKRVIVTFAFVLFSALFFVKNLLYVQFTMVSAMAFVAAYFWYITKREKRDTSQEICDNAVCLIFLFLSMVIRKNTFYMLAVFMIAEFVYRIIRWKENRKRELIYVGSVIVMVLLVNGVDKWAYSAEEYQTYKEYNMARSSVYDYYGLPEYNENYELYKELGISANLYEGMVEYSLALEKDEITTELLNKIADYQGKRTNQEIPQIVERIKGGIEDIMTSNGYTKAISIFGISMLVLGVIIALLENDMLLYYFYLGGVGAAECLYFSYKNRLLEHLLSPIFLVIMITVFRDIFCRNKERNTWKERLCMLYFTALGTMLLVPCMNGLQEMKETSEKHTDEADYVTEITEADKENFYYVDAWLFYGNLELQISHEKWEGRNFIPDGGWGTKHPLYERVLEQNNLNTMSEDILKDNVYFISPRGKYYIIRYYLESGRMVKVETVDAVQLKDETAYVYKVKLVDTIYPLIVEDNSIDCSNLEHEVSVMIIETETTDNFENGGFYYSLIFPNNKYEHEIQLKRGRYDIVYLDVANWKNIQKFSYEKPSSTKIKSAYVY